jgi:nucleoside-diphosphate-sugar epimerase
MQTVTITGATGFVGRHLLNRLLQRQNLMLRALAHNSSKSALQQGARLHWIRGDLADFALSAELFAAGGTLINLAFPAHWSRASHLANAASLAEAAAAQGVRRVIHCSTAAVVGQTSIQNVNEAAPTRPHTEYEKTKLAIEDIWRAAAAGRYDLAIVRPTAVFGPHGKNLLKLAAALTAGSRLANYARSSLFARRRMNLVCVRNVVAALEFLIDCEQPLGGNTFIVAEDDEPGNNFREVERVLMRGLGVRDYALPPLPVPLVALRVLLHVAGKAAAARKYDSSRLARAGWEKACGFEEGLREFAAWYATSSSRPGCKPR